MQENKKCKQHHRCEMQHFVWLFSGRQLLLEQRHWLLACLVRYYKVDVVNCLMATEITAVIPAPQWSNMVKNLIFNCAPQKCHSSMQEKT